MATAVLLIGVIGGAAMLYANRDGGGKESAPSSLAVYAKGSLSKLLTPAPTLAPDYVFKDAEGRDVRFSAFKGKVAVVNLWATWCAPCQREMPALQRAQQQYPGVHFVFANQGESVEQVQRYLALKGLALEHVLLDRHGQVARHFQQRALPTTFFFDADGTLVEARTGELSDASIAQRMARWPGAAVKP